MEWIRTEDRLPFNGDRVLVVCNGNVFHAYFQDMRYTSFGFIKHSFRDDSDGRYEDVVYWMPLPKPPEGM